MIRYIACCLGVLMVATTMTAMAHAQPEDERTFRSEHFSITWAPDQVPEPSDADGNGTPDAIERLAATLEEARTFLLDQLGYRPPPGDDPYPIYLGSTRGYVRAAPGGEGDSRPSFIVFPTALVADDVSAVALRAFAVHEYMHAIQEGYDHSEDHWIQEASAAWVEDLFDDPSDPNHRYLQSFIAYPERGLEYDSGNQIYGAFLFLQFLTERYGGGSETGASLVREIWEEIAPSSARDLDSFAAIGEVLARRGVTLADAWSEFLHWRWQLRRFEEGSSYRAALPTAWPVPASSVEVAAETCRVETAELPTAAGQYVRLVPRDRQRGRPWTITAEGSSGATAMALVKRAGTRPEEHLLDFDVSGVARLHLTDDPPVRRVTVALGNAGTDDQAIAYSARRDASRKVRTDLDGDDVATFGIGTTLSGTVTCAGSPAPFADVVITESDVNGRTQTYEVATDRSGSWRASVRPEAHATYSANVVDPLLTPVTAGLFDVTVQVAVYIEVADTTVARGADVVIDGEVFPLHPGVPVVLERRRPEGPWRTADEVTVGPDGNFQMSFVPPAPGIWEIRARVVATNDHDHAPGSSFAHLISVSE